MLNVESNTWYGHWLGVVALQCHAVTLFLTFDLTVETLTFKILSSQYL